jgi:hypothetical protein
MLVRARTHTHTHTHTLTCEHPHKLQMYFLVPRHLVGTVESTAEQVTRAKEELDSLDRFVEAKVRVLGSTTHFIAVRAVRVVDVQSVFIIMGAHMVPLTR